MFPLAIDIISKSVNMNSFSIGMIVFPIWENKVHLVIQKYATTLFRNYVTLFRIYREFSVVSCIKIIESSIWIYRGFLFLFFIINLDANHIILFVVRTFTECFRCPLDINSLGKGLFLCLQLKRMYFLLYFFDLFFYDIGHVMN